MSSRKLTLGAAVDAQRKADFEAAAAARHLTPSALLVVLIDSLLERQPPPPAPPPERGGIKDEKVTVRLTPFYLAELDRLASARNWPRSTYLARLLVVHVDNKPQFCHDEVAAVRQVARQLADMGRNVNQIAKALNTSLDNAHLALAMEFDLVKMLIEVETNAVKELVRANLDQWGVRDVH